jgi:O-antigen ligase/tetratricopeptide (TPR) repeat protein
MDSFLKRRYFECLLIILYLIVGFVPYFNAIDKIAPQYLFLSIVNSLAAIYILFTSKKVSFKYASYVIASLFGLVIWSFISLTHAINKAEVLIETSRVIIFLFAFVNLYVLLNRNQSLLKYIPFFVSIILLIEVSLVYERFIERFTYGASYSRDMGLRAFSGNINITAFSFLLKLPFLLYSISRLKLKFILSFLILTLYVFCLFLLGSRGANLMLLVVFALLFILHFVFKHKFIEEKKYFIFLLISITVAGIINSQLFKNNSSISVIERSTNLNTSSTQQRLRFYSSAVNSISQNPILGVGIGNWKLHATEYDKPFMQDYTVPYHAHNDYLQIFAELGLPGFIFYFGIYLWLFFLIYNAIKSKEFNNNNKHSNLILLCFISLTVYLADSFLNFPFTRPLMQIQNLFFWAVILVVIGQSSSIKNIFSITINQTKAYQKTLPLLFIICGLSFSTFISQRVFKSFRDQQFLTAAASGSYTNYSREYVESLESDLPSITATTIPIETMKANLIYSIKDEKPDDTLHYMIAEGKKQNPFLPFNELTKSVLFIRQEKPDSAYVYAKKAFYEIPNHEIHFELLMDIAEAYKDSLEVDKAFNSIKNKDLRNSFYEKYLKASLNIKNNIGLTENDILDKYSSKNPGVNLSKIFRTIFKVGKKNVEEGYYESLKANDFFKENKFKEAADSFEKAYSFNPQEVSYYENAANSYMQAGNDKKAIEILKEVISKLNPKTGKAEYLLGIIYIGMKENQTGCEYLYKSKNKGFNVDKFMFSKFCNTENIE